jgi:hypothetical protein
MSVVDDRLTALNRKVIFDFTAANRLPAMYGMDFLVRYGGLMSYGPDVDESLDRAASLIDRMLKGAKPKRSAIRTADPMSACHQPQNSQGARSRRAGIAHRPG